MSDCVINVSVDGNEAKQSLTELSGSVSAFGQALGKCGQEAKSYGNALRSAKADGEAFTEEGKNLEKQLKEVTQTLSGGTTRLLDYAAGLKKTAAFWKEAYGEGMGFGAILLRV